MIEDVKTAIAQRIATAFGAKTKLLTFKERESLADFIVELRKMNSGIADLYVQHMECMGDCLRDSEKDLKFWRRFAFIAAAIAIVAIGCAL